MGAFINIEGKRFGRLVVLKRHDVTDQGIIRWLCKCDCGQYKIVRRTDLGRKINSCGCLRKDSLRERTRENSPTWKGGKITNPLGYIMLRIGNRYILEHRAIIENVIGRPLYTYETVHHKNGKRDDNRIENLELRTGQHGCHVRYEDIAKEIPDFILKQEMINRGLVA